MEFETVSDVEDLYHFFSQDSVDCTYHAYMYGTERGILWLNKDIVVPLLEWF